MASELHLIVLWANARPREKEIMADVRQNLKIRDAYDILWSEDCVATNFSRFYGTKLPDKSFKEEECGKGSFLCLVVEDVNPKYDFVETSRGHEKANVTLFRLKEKYRSLTGGGHKVHTTNSVRETNHDAALLLGLNYDDLWKSLDDTWDGTVKKVEGDLVGCHGWKDLRQFFYTLNATVNYVVLRNHEILPTQYKTGLHGDIDILTDDYEGLRFVANAQEVFPERYRVHNRTVVDGESVCFDFRFLGDGYYCARFEEDILRARELNDNQIYVPSTENAFYSLIYHALIQKRKIAPDYYDKIRDLFCRLGLDKEHAPADYADPFDLYYQLLTKFMSANRYEYTRPIDTSVFFSEKIVNLRNQARFLQSHCGFRDIRSICTSIQSDAYNTFLSAYDENGCKLFIKMGSIGGLCKNEYRRALALYEIDPAHFVRPVYYRDDGGNNFVASEFLSGESLENVMKNGSPSTEEKRGFVQDIHDIYRALKESDVVHRDVSPRNIIRANGHLHLIDFQLAVSKTDYRELTYLKNDIKLLSGLGREYAYCQFRWDDSYSLLKVLEFVGCEKEYEGLYSRVYDEIKANVGKDSVALCKESDLSRLKLQRILYKLKGKFSFSRAKRRKYRQKREAVAIMIRALKSAKKRSE